MTAPGGLSDQDVAKVAAEAGVDARTVIRALEGRTRMLLVRTSIARALRHFGFKGHAIKLERQGKK